MTKKTGELQYGMFNDIAVIVRNIETLFINIPSVILSIFVVIVILAKFSVYLLFFSAIMIVLLFVQFSFFQKPLKRSFEDTKNTEQQIIGEMNEHFDRIELIKLYNKESISIRNFDLRFGKLIKKYLHQRKLNLLGLSFSSIIVQFWLIGMSIIAMLLLSVHSIILADFVLVSQIGIFLPQGFGTLLNAVWDFQDCSVSINRFQEFTEQSQIINGSVKISEIDTISLDGVEVILDDFNLTSPISLQIQPGDFVVIKGVNGSGKSSLLRILTKLIPLESGDVTINNYDIEEIEKQSLNAQMSVLTQKSFVFETSLKENIFFDGNNEKLYKNLCTLLGIDDSISEKKSGVLSGGERQKINLLRTLYRNKKVMIFDEPFSGLDQKTIKNLLEYFESNKNDKIYIVVSHDNHFDDLATKTIIL